MGSQIYGVVAFFSIRISDQPTPNDVQNYYELFTNLWKVILVINVQLIIKDT
jgi:hypothetical protein